MVTIIIEVLCIIRYLLYMTMCVYIQIDRYTYLLILTPREIFRMRSLIMDVVKVCLKKAVGRSVDRQTRKTFLPRLKLRESQKRSLNNFQPTNNGRNNYNHFSWQGPIFLYHHHHRTFISFLRSFFPFSSASAVDFSKTKNDCRVIEKRLKN